MQKLIFASNNAHKLNEVRSILAPLCSVVSPREIGIESDPEENAPTLEGNALIKARALFALTQQACFADDTGLEVEALGGAPGVHSARYASPTESNDAANRAKLLQELSAHPLPHKARFRTVVAYINSRGEEFLFEGIVQGIIIDQMRGTAGFGYDALFVPEEETRTFAEMSDAEKNAISHRGRAVLSLKNFLDTHPQAL